MDFQHLASIEARALADRLLQEHAAASLRHVRILRDALDRAAQEISAPGDPGPLIQALVERLTTAAAAEVEHARQGAAEAVGALESDLQIERARAEQLAAALADADAVASRLATEADAARAHAVAVEQQAAGEADQAATRMQEHLLRIDQLSAALADAERQAESVAAELAAERGRTQAADHRATEAEARLDAGRAEIERLTAALQEAERQAAASSADLAGARARADALDQDLALAIDAHAEVERALGEVQADLRRAEQRRLALEGDLAASQELLDAAQREASELHGQVERQVATIAGLEGRVADALDASADREALTTELESRRVRIEALEDAARERDTHARALETRVEDASRSEVQLLEDLAARELALEHERTAARGVREQLDLVVAAHESAATRIQSLEGELAARDRALEHEQTAVRDVRQQLDLLTAERDTLHAELTARAARLTALEAELADVTRAAHEERGGLAERLEIAIARADTLEQAHAAEVTARTQIQAQLDVLAREASEAEASTVRPDHDPAAETLQRDVDRLAALFDGSVRALAEMAQVTSSADLLTALAKRLSLQFSRVALFRAKGDRLAGEQQIGFDELDITTLALPSSGESLVARALRAGTLARATGPEAGDTGLPPGGPSTLALALPILLNGVPIAVIYADDAGMPVAETGHETSVQFAELLVGHAVALLVRYTHELKTMAELREYAATLLAEARTMYTADLESGRSGDELRTRLRESLDCASQLYAYRAAMEGTVAAGLLDEQIAEASVGESAFAQDLRLVTQTCESLILNP